MEIVAAVIGPVVECASYGAAERWKHHRHIKKNMRSLRKASEKLKCRKDDLKTRLKIEVIPGETEETEELKCWIKSVEDMTCAIEEIDKEARQVKFLSRAGVGRRVKEMIPEVDKLYEDGVQFREGSLVRTLPQRGNEKPTTSGLFGGNTPAEKTKGEILRCLVDEKATRIGVYGMGGSGKTTVLEHLHNDLLKAGDKIGSKFDKVIWITASKGTGVRGLQDRIGVELKLSLDEKNDDRKKASVLLREFNKPENKRFLLIIDDLWEDYPLETIGVPNPTPENGCKLVITTRALNVCSQMECDKKIKMGLLSEREAEKLFLDKVGNCVASDPRLPKMARNFAKECAGLPLAIVTVAGSMRDKTDVKEWEVALTELKDATHSALNKITTILMFSYDRLKDVRFKECLLHCALYPEDHLIDRSSLIYQLIAQGSIDDGRTVKARKDKCHVMLNELVRDCLLIDVNERKCVKLHDSVRDMAIQIMRETPSRYLLDAKGGKKWDEGLEKVSFRGNNKTIPVAEPPNCPRLSTLLFINAEELEIISEDFFTGMKGLCVLDLSGTSIETLPGSVTSLENLAVLSLRDCENLTCLPDMSELINLIRLDLGYSGITEYPQGLEKLVKLTHLDLGGVKVEHYTKGLLSEVSNLIYLSIELPSGAGIESAIELAALQNLEYLRVAFPEIRLSNAYLRLIPSKAATTAQPCDFIFTVGEARSIHDAPNSMRIYINNDGPWVWVPNNVENLRVEGCVGRSLCRMITSVENIINLQTLEIYDCKEMEYMLYNSPTVFPLLQNINELELGYLDSLRAVMGPENDGTALPLGAFSSLKKLEIYSCHKLKTLFVVGKEASLSLPSLEVIIICDCRELEEIISYENEDAMIINLPRLESITLWRLPKLKSAQFHVPDSLSKAEIIKCPELKEVTPSLQPFMRK